MTLRVVRLGSPRTKDEGLRIGTVRRPPRGVPKSEYAARDFYDLWYPTLAPSVPAMKQAQQAVAEGSDAGWAAFARAYRAEMAAPDAAHAIALLAALSHTTNLAVGCYCENESRCHRSLLRELLTRAGADVA
jgi:uncharacterized protein YeaO (DUF488 family)